MPTTTYIQSFMKIGHCVLAKTYLFVDEQPISIHPYLHTYIHPYIYYTYRQRVNENLSGPSSIAGGPQKWDYSANDHFLKWRDNLPLLLAIEYSISLSDLIKDFKPLTWGFCPGINTCIIYNRTKFLKWNEFHIFNLSWDLNLDDLWPWHVTSDLNNKWRFLCCIYELCKYLKSIKA